VKWPGVASLSVAVSRNPFIFRSRCHGYRQHAAVIYPCRVIERIVPAEAATAEAFDDPPGLTLFPEEEAVIANAVDKRRREFTTVRHCARQALARLGHGSVPILPGQQGVPRWPAGLVGSMTHCQGYRAAVLGRIGDFASIGVDAESNEPLPEGVLDAVARDRERAEIAGFAATYPYVCWDRLLFSA
jgi:4'-phosphopantetheinyl transferase EntD